MFKVYKWLGYYLLRPYKRFEHLLKYLAIYFAKLNKIPKNRKERLNRIKKKDLPFAQGRGPLTSAGPAHLEGVTCVLFPPGRQAPHRRPPWARQAAACLPRALSPRWRRPDPSPFL